MTEETNPDTPEPETTPEKREKLLGKRRFTIVFKVTKEHIAGLTEPTWEALSRRLVRACFDCLESLTEQGKAELAKATKEQLELELTENRKREQELRHQLANLRGT